MLSTYSFPEYPYRRPPDLDADAPAHYPLAVIGAGPIGLGAAIDAALHGFQPVVLDDNNTVSVGSRAVCYAKRALEILDRYGIGQQVVDKGVTWNTGKVFRKNRLAYSFNLLPEEHHQRPAFVNLQQYYLEEFLIERAAGHGGIDLRWKNEVVGVQTGADYVTVTVATPDGAYRFTCDYLIVADGANSDVRTMLGLESTGQVFEDRFLIADVLMKADFPPERWFWFDPPFHPGQSTLLHRQADDVWRIDFQLGRDADPEQEKMPEKVVPRLKAMLGEDVEFELEWVSVYTFQCRRMAEFRHGRVLFVGDAAHQVSPFGARGANGGYQDTDNLLWKLALARDGKAPDTLLDTYSEERVYAADENILNSTRSTDFITPKSDISRAFRDATVALAEHYPFARKLVNSGRLSVPAVYRHSSLNTPDTERFAGNMQPGTPCADAPVVVAGTQQWFLRQAGGRFTLLVFAATADLKAAHLEQYRALYEAAIPVNTLLVTTTPVATDEWPAATRSIVDHQRVLTGRYDGKPGTCYLIRPDQHVAARWRSFDGDAVRRALATATAQDQGLPVCIS